MGAHDQIDVEAIKQLKARYFRLLDTADWAAWGEVFTRDAVLQWGPGAHQVIAGREEIVAAVSASLAGAVTCHSGHTPEITLEGDDHARGIWAMSDLVDHPAYRLEGYGHYHERYRREDGVWRIERTELRRLRTRRTSIDR